MASEKRRRARRKAFLRSVPDRWPLKAVHLWSPRRGLVLLAGPPERLAEVARKLRRGESVRVPCSRPEAIGPAGLPHGFPSEPLSVEQVESRSGFRFRWFRALEIGPGETSLRLEGERVVGTLFGEDLERAAEALEAATFPMFSYQALVYHAGAATLALAGDWLGIE